MWLNQLKIAIIEKDIERLSELMDTLPKLSKQEDIEIALSLIGEATKLVEGLRDGTNSSMLQIQKNISFLKSTQAPFASTLDINS